MKRLLATLVVAGACLGGVSTAHAIGAAPAPGLAAPPITLVEGGCGPGGFRDRFGYCRPRRPFFRRGYYCRPGFHPTPYGCRPNF